MSNIQNITNTPQDSGLGDNLKVAFDKVNENFIELNETKLEDAPLDGQQYVRQDGNWEQIQVPSSQYDGNSPSTRGIENIPVGADLTQFSLTDLIENIYAPYIAPVFNSFTISGQNTLIEVGTAFSGNKVFLWDISVDNNVAPNSIQINNITDGQILASNLENDGTELADIGVVPNSTPRTTLFRIFATNTNSNLFTRDFSVSSLYPYFYGKSNTTPIVNQSLIDGGTKVVANSTGTLTINFNASEEFIWFAIPESSTSKTKWFVTELNQGNIGGGSNLFSSETFLEVNTVLWNDINYKVYVSNYATTINTNMQLRNN